MKNSRHTLWGLSLLSVLLASCGGGTSSTSSTFVPSEESLWSTYATAKVIQQPNRNNEFTNTGKNIVAEMMKGEKESAQIIFTSKARHTFDIVTSDLVDEATGNKLPSSAVEVYMQRYLNIDVNLHSTTKLFFYAGESIPDFLLPLNYAKQAKENVVEANMNQGFTFDFDSTGVEAGTYKGAYKLVLDGKEEIDIPVEVTVWDFELEGKSDFQSCWLVYSMYMLPGEYDASEAMLDTYADFLAEYKANPYLIQPKPMNSPEALMQDVKRMWDIKNFNTITIPYDFQLDYTADSPESDIAVSYIVKLAENSTEDHFYLDYTIFCPSTYDEADMFENKSAASPAFFKKGGNYQLTLEKAISTLESKGYFVGKSEAWASRVKAAIRAIPNPFTNVNYVESWTKSFPATFCPEENVLNSQTTLEVYKDYAKKTIEDIYEESNAEYSEGAKAENPRPNGNLWTYTCVNPDYPYPSHHIDDDCLSMRELGWMEKSYNVNGYLYYMANMYAYENQGGKYCDPYTVPNRQGGANGDGFIMYPGRKYGSPKPFPSSRLLTYREGLEDYDMLLAYERKVNALAEEYGVSGVDSDDLVQDVYNRMFNFAIGTEDHAKFYSLRREFAKRVEKLNNQDDLFYFPKKGNDGKFSLEIYSKSSALEVNGRSVATEDIGEGRYHASIPVEGIVGTISFKTTHALVDDVISPYKNLTSFSPSSSAEVSEESSIEKRDGSIKTIIRSVQKTTVAKTQKFHPSIYLENLDLNGAKELFFDYENYDLTPEIAGDENEVEFNVYLTSKSGLEDGVGGHYVLPPEQGSSVKKHISLNLDGIDASKYDGVTIEFKNCFIDGGELTLLPDRGIIVSDIGAR